MNNKLNGNYLGMVICNSDPLKKGRLQIYIPSIYPIDENEWKPKELDSYFSFPMEENSDETQPLNTKILDNLKLILPWAEPALPIAAGNASGRYNAKSQQATTSDSNLWKSENGKYSIECGPRPAQGFKKGENSIPDAFNKQNGLVPPNPYSYEYSPPDYSNTARGMFSVPNVGSHLWVFFKEGNHMCPVYFASCAGGNDYNSIYEYDINGTKISVDYPSAYENNAHPIESEIPDSLTFRSKTVLNSNKNTIELIDTDLREILRMTHYSGSFKEFNNLTNIELATKNDQKMVLGDQYQTVNGNRGSFVGKNQDTFVVGDNVKYIGKVPDKDMLKTLDGIYGINQAMYNINRLFNVQRCLVGEPPNQVSTLQKRIPSPLSPTGVGYTLCPTCGAKSFTATELASQFNFYPYMTNAARGIMGVEYLMLFYEMLSYQTALAAYLKPLEGMPGIKFGEKCATCSELIPDTEIFIPTGFSPSTEAGMWMPEPLKTIDSLGLYMSIAQTRLIPKIAALGKGDEVININQNKIETIGLKMNDLSPYRIDPAGKLRINSIQIAPGGVYEKFTAGPLIEAVDLLDMPGDYNLTVNNKYKLLVGAKGVDIKTFGPFNLNASIINFAGNQINITSMNEINLDGGKRLNIRAEHISLSPYEHDPVVIDSPLHVTRNITTKGGMYVDGEVGLQHVTAPSEMQETLWSSGPGINMIGEVAHTKTLFKTGKLIYDNALLNAGIITGIPGAAEALVAPHVHVIPPHTHAFFNIPLNLCFGKEHVRAWMAERGINSQKVTVSSDPIRGFNMPGSDLTPTQSEGINQFLNGCDGVIKPEFDTVKGSLESGWYLPSYLNNTEENTNVISQTDSEGNELLSNIVYRRDYRITDDINQQKIDNMIAVFKVTGNVKITKGVEGAQDTYDIVQPVVSDGCSDPHQRTMTSEWGSGAAANMEDIKNKIAAL